MHLEPQKRLIYKQLIYIAVTYIRRFVRRENSERIIGKSIGMLNRAFNVRYSFGFRRWEANCIAPHINSRQCICELIVRADLPRDVR